MWAQFEAHLFRSITGVPHLKRLEDPFGCKLLQRSTADFADELAEHDVANIAVHESFARTGLGRFGVSPIQRLVIAEPVRFEIEARGRPEVWVSSCWIVMFSFPACANSGK